MNTLSLTQRAQLRDAFTVVDSASQDAAITADDVVAAHKSLGLKVPSKEAIGEMLQGEERLEFARFSAAVAAELLQLDDRAALEDAFRVFGGDIDVAELREACCLAPLGDSGQRLSHAAFDELTRGFVRERMDGTKVFYSGKWLENYIE